MAHMNNGIMCICASVLILLMDQSTGCDEAAVKQCISNTIDSSDSIYGIPPSASLLLLCSKLGDFKRCSQGLGYICSGNRLPDPTSRVLYAIASTMCGSVLPDVDANANCWDMPDVQTRFKSCATSTLIYTCSDSQKVNRCMEDAVRSNCGQKQVTVFEKILKPTQEAMFYPATCGTGHLKSQCMVVLAALFVLKYVFRIL